MKGRLSRDIEEKLSLYLDGRLPKADRAEFERRIESDPDLRHALEFHRGLTLEFHEEAPPLPRGYAERARARAERALAARRGRSSRDPGAVPDGPVLAWWQRLFTMEAAGAVAAVLLVAVLLYPQVRPPSRVPAIESPVPESGPAGAQRGQGRTRTKAEADQETVDALRSLGYISSGRPAAPPAGAKKRSEAKAMPKAGLASKPKPAAREGAAAGLARSMAAPVAPGAAPAAPEPKATAPLPAAAPPSSVAPPPPTAAPPAAAAPAAALRAPDEASPSPPPVKAQVEAEATRADVARQEARRPQNSTLVSAVPYRAVPIPKAPGEGRDYLEVRSAEEWSAFVAGAGAAAAPPAVAFDKEMMIVLRDDLLSDPPSRLRVVSVATTGQEIVIECRIERRGPPPPGGAPSGGASGEGAPEEKPPAPGQAVIVPITDLPVRVVIH